MAHKEHALGWPSVTQFLHSYDLTWMPFFYKKHKTFEAADAYSQQAKERGTRIHKAFEILLANGPLEQALAVVMPHECFGIQGLYNWITQNEVMSLGEERSVECKRARYHGTLDNELNVLNASWYTQDFWRNPIPPLDGPLHCLGDLKTQQDGREVNAGEIKKHAMQLALYSYANEEATGRFINHGLVINLDITTGIVSPVPIYPLSAHLKPALLQRELYDYQKSDGEWNHLRMRKKAA